MARVSRLGPEWTRMLSKARVGPTRPANDQRQDGDFCDLTSQPGSSQRKSLVEPGPPCIGRGDRTLCVVERTGKPEELLGSSGSNHHALPKMKLKSESCDAMGLPASTPKRRTTNQRRVKSPPPQQQGDRSSSDPVGSTPTWTLSCHHCISKRKRSSRDSRHAPPSRCCSGVRPPPGWMLRAI
ncbi:conserved hypothetical protein [Coccidioides posadasii str. Silveira]|uniref:Uncharacterized protein n=1 Tax=Coccidioides posadasii (strain RMSCC 757 / Silveira) TaxID=443226 RepID=E9D005_COCPS|nr:conserved hypothetical protein [Coccidioides posadasii str. Silveira]